jgi:hypothetical protein
MGTFINDGASVLPPVKANATTPTGASTEWAAEDANKDRSALLDLRTQAILNRDGLTEETQNRIDADSAILALGTGAVVPLNNLPVTSTGTPTARVIASRFADCVNAMDYGLIPDDQSPAALSANWQAMNAAFLAAEARHTRVYVPGRQYYLDHTVTLTPDSSENGMVSEGATFLWVGAEVGVMFLLSGGYGFKISNIHFRNTKTSTHINGVPANSSGVIAVEMFQDFQGKTVCSFDNCRFTMFNIAVFSYRTGWSSGGQAEEIKFYTCHFNQCYKGVELAHQNNDYWSFDNCQWSYNVIGVSANVLPPGSILFINSVMTSPGDRAYSCWYQCLSGNSTNNSVTFIGCQSEITRLNFDVTGYNTVNYIGGVFSGGRCNQQYANVNLFGTMLTQTGGSDYPVTRATANGTDDTFAFTASVNPATPLVMVWLDDVLQRNGIDFTTTGNPDQVANQGGTITFAVVPTAGQRIYVCECSYSCGIIVTNSYLKLSATGCWIRDPVSGIVKDLYYWAQSLKGVTHNLGEDVQNWCIFEDRCMLTAGFAQNVPQKIKISPFFGPGTALTIDGSLQASPGPFLQTKNMAGLLGFQVNKFAIPQLSRAVSAIPINTVEDDYGSILFDGNSNARICRRRKTGPNPSFSIAWSLLGPYFASTLPTSGTFYRGDVIWNDEVVAGGSPGWICIQGGTYGTLLDTTIDTVAASGSAMLNNINQLAMGEFFTIAGVGGGNGGIFTPGGYWLPTIPTDPVATYLSPVPNATVTGAACSYSPPVWKAMANIAA